MHLQLGLGQMTSKMSLSSEPRNMASSSALHPHPELQKDLARGEPSQESTQDAELSRVLFLNSESLKLIPSPTLYFSERKIFREAAS